MLPFLTLMVDPGGMTGLAALYGQDPDLRLHAREDPPEVAADVIWHMASLYDSRLTLCWERYTITARTAKLTRQNDALEMIGVLKFAARKHGCLVAPERQQATPSREEQEVLRRLGWWREGKDDAQSAAGHMLRFVLDSGSAPPKVLDAVVNREKMHVRKQQAGNRRGAGGRPAGKGSEEEDR